LGFCSDQSINFLADIFFHANQRRPGPFESLARQLARRINAQLAADGDFAGGVVEPVGRS